MAGFFRVAGAPFAHGPGRLDAAARSVGAAASAAAGSGPDAVAIAFAETGAGSRSRAAAFARAVAVGVRRALLENANAVPRVGGGRNDWRDNRRPRLRRERRRWGRGGWAPGRRNPRGRPTPPRR